MEEADLGERVHPMLAERRRGDECGEVTGVVDAEEM
jgi:hypothetical protein